MTTQSYQMIMNEKGGIEEFDLNDFFEDYVSHFYYTRQNRAKGKAITSFKDLKDDIIANVESLLKVYTIEKLNEMKTSGEEPIVWSMNWYKYPDLTREENIELDLLIENTIQNKYDAYCFRYDYRGKGKETILVAVCFCLF